MPQRDPLEELFRRSSEELEQRPSLRGWHRLERKLDGKSSVKLTGRRGRHRTQGFFKPWYYAAAAVALVLMIMIGVGKQSGGIDRSLLAKAPESVEDFQLEGSLPTRVSAYEGISEGDRGKVLTVRNSSIPKFLPAEKYRL